MANPSCSPAVCKIEALIKERRRLGSILLNLDAYDRWGHGSDEQRNAELEKATAYAQKSNAVREETIQLVQQLSREDRQSWAGAHISLLQDFLARCETATHDTSTARYVARKEIEAWQKVQDGTENSVQQNVFYIHYHNDLYQQFFGLDY